MSDSLYIKKIQLEKKSYGSNDVKEQINGAFNEFKLKKYSEKRKGLKHQNDPSKNKIL